MRRFWAIVSMDPYCRLCIHMRHYPHPSPDPVSGGALNSTQSNPI